MGGVSRYLVIDKRYTPASLLFFYTLSPLLLANPHHLILTALLLHLPPSTATTAIADPLHQATPSATSQHQGDALTPFYLALHAPRGGFRPPTTPCIPRPHPTPSPSHSILPNLLLGILLSNDSAQRSYAPPALSPES